MVINAKDKITAILDYLRILTVKKHFKNKGLKLINNSF